MQICPAYSDRENATLRATALKSEAETRTRERSDLASVAEREQADDREALLRSGREHVDRITDVKPLSRRLHVHRDSPGRAPAPTPAAIEVDDKTARGRAADERHAERRCGAAIDRIAVFPDELRAALDEPARRGDAVSRPYVGEHRVGESFMVVLAGSGALHDDVDARHRSLEHAAERLVERVREHIGGGESSHRATLRAP